MRNNVVEDAKRKEILFDLTKSDHHAYDQHWSGDNGDTEILRKKTWQVLLGS